MKDKLNNPTYYLKRMKHQLMKNNNQRKMSRRRKKLQKKKIWKSRNRRSNKKLNMRVQKMNKLKRIYKMNSKI